MRSNALAFLFGILGCSTLSTLPSFGSWYFLLFLLFCSLAWKFPRFRVLAFLSLGFLWMAFRSEMVLSQKLPTELEGQTITVVGYVTELPQRRNDGWQFYFFIQELTYKETTYPFSALVRLSWYHSLNQKQLRPGERWQLSVRLKRPHVTLNPGAFDYSSKLFQQKVRAIGYVYQKGENTLLAAPSPYHIDNFRYHLAQTLHTKLQDYASKAIIIALVVNEQQGISQDQWEALRYSGITHVISVSGLHISLVALLTLLITRRLWSYSNRAMLWLPAPYFAGGCALITATLYTILAGFPIPTQRALIMVAVFVYGVIFTHRAAISHLIAFALFLILLWEPFAIMDIGFWLSFAGISLIAYIGVIKTRHPMPDNLKRLPKQPPHKKTALERIFTELQYYFFKIQMDIRRIFTLQWGLLLSFSPILLYLFGYITAISFTANLITIFWANLIIIPMTLLGVVFIGILPSLSTFLLQLAGYTLDALWVSIEWLIQLKWAIWHWPPATLSVTLVATVGTLILLLPHKFPGKWIGIFWCLPLFLSPRAQPQPGDIWFTLLDVGQGQAAVIRTQNHTVIYDPGPQVQTGTSIIAPFLAAQGIYTIDRVIISHKDRDHSHGTAGLLTRFPNAEVLSDVPRQFNKSHPCHEGQHWEYDGVIFQILNPVIGTSSDSNNHSCVLKISNEKNAILLTSDIESAAESRLVNTYGKRLKADILVAPHHGSKTSSTEQFINEVSPKIVLFSVGYKNQYGFPKSEILQRYQTRHIKTYQTPETGAMTFYLTKEGLIKQDFARETLKRYWHE